MKRLQNILILLLVAISCNFSTCRFGTKDVSFPANIKTFSMDLFTNRAGYVNPQLAPRLTEKFRQKVIGQTKLRPLSDKGDYHISGYVNSYDVSTTGINAGQASNNRLTVTFHVILKNNVDDKQSFESDVTRSFEFSAQSNLAQAEVRLLDDMVRNLTDEIFNKLFSNW